MSTAIEVAVGFYAVADYLDITVFANRGEGIYGALEAVEGVRVSTGHSDGERLIVVVAADLTLGHDSTPFLQTVSLS